jgi:predicted ATPase
VAGMEDAPLHAALGKLVEADIVLVQGLPPDSAYRFKHALIQDAAYENLLKSRRQVLHRRAAEILRDRFADTAAAEPEVLAHHFTQSGLTDAATEWWGRAGDQALRRSAFQEAISHLGKAIEMADKEGGGKPGGTTRPATTSASERLKLQTSYGQALLWSKGYADREAKAAFARAEKLASGIQDSVERFKIYYGQWLGNLLRSEHKSAQLLAEALLYDAEVGNRIPEAAVCRRILGLTRHVQGAFVEAQALLERALTTASSAPEFRVGLTMEIAAGSYLAHTAYVRGEPERARELITRSVAHAVQTRDVPDMCTAYAFESVLRLLLNEPEAAHSAANRLVTLGEEHGTRLFADLGRVCAGLAQLRFNEADSGFADVRQALRSYTDQGNKLWAPLYLGLLAAAEANEEVDTALRRIDEALALAAETGEYWTDAFLHRIRGNILLKRDPVNTALAEEAFLAAIAIAQHQKARSFELQAALTLAKLYHSTGRATDAYAALASALEGFSPTPEFPEIAEAQTLVAALAETDVVRSAAAARQRRLHLQTSYGQALLWSKGYADEEAKAAFTRAEELASGIEDPAERLKIYYGQCLGNLLRGEYASAQSLAEGLLRDAQREGRAQQTAFARRILGLTHHMQGAFPEAQAQLERALNSSTGGDELQVGLDMDIAAKAYLSHSVWVQGEFARARSLINESVARAEAASDIPDQCTAYSYLSLFAILRNDAEAARGAAERLIAVAQEHGAKLFLLVARVYAGWARASLDRSSAGQSEFQEALADYTAEGNKWLLPFYLGILAAIQGETQGEGERAAARIYEALALAQQTGEHWTDALLHRIRGEILLKLNPANTAPAEDAFLTAITIAQKQKAKSFELRAALSLAKIYQNTNRAADAHAVLVPALQGFSPTPEFPEIERAQRLIGALH